MADLPDRRVMVLEEELARVRQDLERAIDAVPAAQLHLAHPADGWTPAQLIWHLAKVERGVARLLERLDAELPPMSTVPPGPRSNQVLGLLDKANFKDRSRRLVAPDGLRPPATVDVVAERGRLADGRAQLLGAIRDAGPRLSLLRYDHVYFGPFDGWQWALMVARHEERHMLQLAEILAATA